MEKERMDKRLWLGIIIVIAGLALMSKNFGILSDELYRYIFRWEMILITLGLVFILNRSNRIAGIILLVIGGALYLSHIIGFNLNFWQLLLPSLLILAGILIIFRDKIEGNSFRSYIPDDEDHIDESAIFGGGDRVVRSQQFMGGKVTAIFGGLNYNMLKARLSHGANYIDVFCIFGGMKLIVPEDWNVKIRVMSIFGGFSDKHRILSTGTSAEQDTQLIIKGIVIFGGGEITSDPD